MKAGSANMAETRSLFSINEKMNILSLTKNQHDQELRSLNQKMDVVTSVLKTLKKTVQGLSEAGSRWQQRSSWEAGQFTSWEAFVRALHVRFGTTTYDDPMETLTRLRQVHSVAIYKGQFEALSN